MADVTKVLLDESEIPQAWYNLVPDLPSRLLHPSIPAPTSRSDRTTWRHSSPWT